MEPWFIFSLVWTLGATCDNDGRKRFDKWLRETMKEVNVSFKHTSYVHESVKTFMLRISRDTDEIELNRL